MIDGRWRATRDTPRRRSSQGETPRYRDLEAWWNKSTLASRRIKYLVDSIKSADDMDARDDESPMLIKFVSVLYQLLLLGKAQNWRAKEETSYTYHERQWGCKNFWCGAGHNRGPVRDLRGKLTRLPRDCVVCVARRGRTDTGIKKYYDASFPPFLEEMK